MAARDDTLLVKRLKDKEPSAMDEMVDLFSSKIYSLAIGILKNNEDAEDVVQDTLLQVYEKIDTFRGEAALSSWIYRIALNFAYMKIRKVKKNSHMSFEEEMPKFQKDGMHLGTVSNWAEQTEDSVINKEMGKLLKDSIEKLPEKYKVILTLRDITGLSTEETANVTGMTVPAVKSRLHRARLFLRESLSEYYKG